MILSLRYRQTPKSSFHRSWKPQATPKIGPPTPLLSSLDRQGFPAIFAGSFACLQTLIDALKKREVKYLVQMVLVELFVMFFEVMFLYRELVDAITPWIVQQTGEEFRLGIIFTMSVATFGWIGIRGMAKPRELFVGAIGGKDRDEPKAFHPIHDFQGKDIGQIEANLREWFPATDTLTDFNSFFQQVARIAKERNLILAPITVIMVSDGIPDVGAGSIQAKSQALYEKIDLSPMEYLSRNLTLRLTYASPKVGENWREFVPRQRVRMWAVEADVMKGWLEQIEPGVDPAGQGRLWKWVQDNVDFRVRSKGI